MRHKKISEQLIEDEIEPRIIVFLENGINLEHLGDRNESNKDKPWTRKLPNNCAININKYIAKYDFDFAQKLNNPLIKRKQNILDLFTKKVVDEVLAMASYELTDDRKTFRSIWMLDGTPIRNLDLLPRNTQVLLVSELPYPKDEAYFAKLKADQEREEMYRKALIGLGNEINEDGP